MLAEQIAIDCAPSVLEDLFCDPRARWLEPLLRLAGDEGEAAGLVLLGERAHSDRRQSARRRTHDARIGRMDPDGPAFRVGLRWRTTDYRALFAEFDGTLSIRPVDGHAVVSVEGRFSAPAGPATARMAAGVGGPPASASRAARRAAESAVRGLLNHLRAAVEDRSLPVG